MLIIRPANPGDSGALASLDHATWTRQNSPVERRDPERDFFATMGEGHEVLVAEDAKRTVGYVHLAPATSLASNAHVLELRGLAVDPNQQGKGIGRALLDMAAQRASVRGATKLRLRVLSTNIQAIALYERAGYAVEAVLEGEFVIDGAPVDDVLMCRPIP